MGRILYQNACIAVSKTRENGRSSYPFNPLIPEFKKYILPTFYRVMYTWCNENLEEQSFFYLSKLWKAKLFILCNVILLGRLKEKFELDHSWEWEGWTRAGCWITNRDEESTNPGLA